MKYTQWNAAAFDQAAAERLHAAGHPRLLSAVMAAGLCVPAFAAEAGGG